MEVVAKYIGNYKRIAIGGIAAFGKYLTVSMANNNSKALPR
jgi:hypothetical protein